MHPALPTLELFDPSQGAHRTSRSIDDSHSLRAAQAPIQLSIPSAKKTRGEPYRLRPYGDLASGSRVQSAHEALLYRAHYKCVGSRRLSDSLSRVAWHGSRGIAQRVRNSFFAQRTSAKTIWYVCCPLCALPICGAGAGVFLLTMGFTQIGCTVQGCIRLALGFLHGRTPEVERILSWCEWSRVGNAMSLVRL